MSGPSNMALNATKAGMTGLDTSRINAIIAEASKGSNFFKAKEKSQAKLDDQASGKNVILCLKLNVL